MGKGEHTRILILQQAVDLASQVGIAGLTIGVLAERTGLSKSGLFAHFGSKEGLQLAVIDMVQQRFIEQVVRPALLQARGLSRLRALLHGWLDRVAHSPEYSGGCPLLAAAFEFDDQPGPIRDRLVQGQSWQRATLERLLQQAVEEGELPAGTDIGQMAFELFGLILAVHHDLKLLARPDCLGYAKNSIKRILNAPASHQGQT